ncbi:MAG: ATP-binding protein [Elusimicrobiota bacterium]
MSIRLKLTLLIGMLFAGVLGGVGASLVRMERAYLMEEELQELRILESTLRRAARDALVARDEILLLSYVKFLQQQFPALAYCRIAWVDGQRTRSHSLGMRASSAQVEERSLRERDPADSARYVQLEAGIDRGVFGTAVDESIRRLTRDIVRLFGIGLILAILFSDLLARRLCRRLSALSSAALEIGKGKLGLRLEPGAADEIGALTRGFNEMSARLEELDALKRDFVSAVTHELRSPLGAIDSFLGLIDAKLRSGPAGLATGIEYLARVKTNVGRLSGFINDLLDVAKIERGKLECAPQPMNLQDLARDVLSFFEAKGREQGVALVSRLDPGLGQVQADPERMRQVLVNLVSNALKFTPKGGSVWIEAEQYRENGRRFLEVSVCDNGRGIEPEEQQKLFKRFQQGKNIAGRVTGTHGTGLGLFIVKSIVEAHGGQVGVRSVPGKGARFLFNLPMTETR